MFFASLTFPKLPSPRVLPSSYFPSRIPFFFCSSSSSFFLISPFSFLMITIHNSLPSLSLFL
uniref:CBL-interacting serine/threonine-protein kinase 1-like n=1 Tax=Rhizophora mucronata TaxID=61149 RepID=A0A2P2JAT4_RHIMU